MLSARITVQAIAAISLTAVIAFGSPCVLPKMQIVPAVMSCSLVWMAVWVAVTLLFGRIYCSTMCPSGALMDAASSLLRRRKSRYTYRQAAPMLRYSILIIAVGCALLGFGILLSLIEPYSAFARIVTACSRPLTIGAAGLITATVTMVAVTYAAARHGRLLCNTVCPVGSVLGVLSRHSLYHADINTDLCVNCGKCSDVCPAECVDLCDHVIDPMRCVTCFKCMDACPTGALTYRRGRHRLSIPMMQPTTVGNIGVTTIARPDAPAQGTMLSRRKFISSGLLAAGTLAAGAAEKGGSRFYVAGAVPIAPLNRVMPPGTSSRDCYLRHCTGCSTCTTTCPTGVLVPSSNGFGIKHALVPVMDFNASYCSFDCKRCTDVCPSGALHPLTLQEKRTTPIGRARITAGNCIMYANGAGCGRCAKACPKRAISIIRTSDGRRVPHVENELCIGCGRCSNVCPSQPYGAIVIEGI